MSGTVLKEWAPDLWTVDGQADVEIPKFLRKWDFDRVIVAHGDVLEIGGKEKLRQAYAFILGAASRSR